ncbi:MAG: molybdate ABC transporter substrate-binding protein [Hyphomicrobiaceae bacterium]
MTAHNSLASLSGRTGRAVILAALAAALFWVPFACASERVTIFAAASMTDALEAVTAMISKDTGVVVRTSFASSSTLAKQIEQGSPADIYLSADEAWMDYLAKRRLLANETRRAWLTNRLVVVVPSRPGLTQAADHVTPVAGDFGTGRIALGDPAHVPAGRYGKAALEHLGLWADMAQRLARADNVRSALVLVERGEASSGIVYATDARISRGVTIVGWFPEKSHAPIIYPGAIVRGRARPEVAKVYGLLQSPRARAIFARYGFGLR